jgi:hypothetical protein
MEQKGTFFGDDGRYRLLVEAVTDFAIYMLDPDGIASGLSSSSIHCVTTPES